MRDQCVKSVEAALGRPLRAGEAKEIEQRIVEAKKQLAQMDRDAYRNMGERERLTAAGKLVSENLQAEFAKKQQRMALDMLAAQNLKSDIESNPDVDPLEMINHILAKKYDDKGKTLSVDSMANARTSVALGRLEDLFSSVKDGMLGLFTNKAMTDDLVREMYGKDTGNATAKQLAEKWRTVAGEMRDTFNRLGGMIGKLDDWFIPQRHSVTLMLRSGKEAWVEYITPKLNRERYVNEDGTLMTDQQIREFLDAAYLSLVTDGANKSLAAGQYSGGGSSKRANKGSESRQIHFKDGDARIEYHAKFGEGDMIDIMHGHIRGMALDIALLERFGSNPEMTFKMMVREYADKARVQAASSLNPKVRIKAMTLGMKERMLQNLYDEVSAKNLSISNTWHNINAAYRSNNIGAKLGGTAITALSDDAIIARTAAIHSMAYSRFVGERMRLLNPANAKDREFARSMGLAMSEFMGTVGRFSDDGMDFGASRSAWAARVNGKLAQAVMQASGLNALTSANKQAFGIMLMDKYGTMTRTKSWRDLEPVDRELLTRMGIKEQDWQIWQKAQPFARDDSAMILSAKDILAISDADMLAIIEPEANAMRQGIMSEIDALNQKNLQEQQWIDGRQAKFESLKTDLDAKLKTYEARQDAKGQAERQALQDRADLLDAQIERAKAQADIDAFLLAEKQQGRIRDFLYAVQEGKDAVKLADKADQNVQRNSSIRGNIGERLGERVGNADRRITEIEAKIRQSERDQTRSVKDKNAEIARRLDKAAQELNDFVAKSTERQTRRQAVADRLNSSIDKRMADLIKRTKEQTAIRYQAHILDEQGAAVIEAGSREKAALYGWMKNAGKGNAGEIIRNMLQFKSWVAAFMMRHGRRALSQENWQGKAYYLAALTGMLTISGMFVLQAREIASGNDPQDMSNKEFYLRALMAGGGLGIYGDIIKSGLKPDGRGTLELITGPFGGDVQNVSALTFGNAAQFYDEENMNAANESIRLIKSHTPFANLWYTKAATDRMIFNQVQEMANPGYLRRKEARDRRKFDRTMWWGSGDRLPDRAPDWEKAVGE